MIELDGPDRAAVRSLKERGDRQTNHDPVCTFLDGIRAALSYSRRPRDRRRLVVSSKNDVPADEIARAVLCEMYLTPWAFDNAQKVAWLDEARIVVDWAVVGLEELLQRA